MLFYAYEGKPSILGKDGPRLFTEREVLDAGASGALASVVPKAIAPGKGARAVASALPVDFNPIGMGQPLTVAIREVYTGNAPRLDWFGGSKGMLVTSAVKSITTIEAKPRALNFQRKAVSPRSRIARPSASEEGTPIAFYSPALIERSLTLDLTIIFDEFPEEMFTSLGDAFAKAAGIPLFLAAGGYLLAAGAVVKLAGQVGEMLFDSQPAFQASEAINIAWPGEVPTPPGFALVAPENVDRIDPDFRAKYQVVGGTLVDANNVPYAGDVPYVIISLDGTPDDSLAKFTPTALSSAVLSRFFGLKDGQAQATDYIVDACKLYNDFQFRQKVDLVAKRIGGLDPKSATFAKDKSDLETQRGTLLKNILTQELKP